MSGRSACVSVGVAREAPSVREVENAHLGGGTLLAASVVHGAEGLVLLQLDDTGHVVRLEFLLQHGGVCQRVDLPALHGLVAADGNLAVAEHLSHRRCSPGL